jgi:Type III restriction enzyme, res subunit/Helicase conserved C-terminal domain
MSAIQINGNNLEIQFGRPWDLDKYGLFLKCKKLPEYRLHYDEASDSYIINTPARFAGILGIEQPAVNGAGLPLPGFLFEHQSEILKLALDAQRFAVWSDCGTGKTLIELEFARQVASITGGRVLIITLNEIVQQTIDEAHKFYGADLRIHRINSREELRQWCSAGPGQIAITNYEKMNPDDQGQTVNEMRWLAGLVLDESSRLKAGGGKQKWALIHSSKGIPYKLSCTATPAPNDVIEFASQASFLERMRSDNEIIWTFFTRDPDTQEWTVKRHARAAFFEWMAAWSIYLRDPRRYGWSSDIELPPEPEILYHQLIMSTEQQDAMKERNVDRDGQIGLFASKPQGIVTRGKFSQIAKGFVYESDGRPVRIKSWKPTFVANLIKQEAHLNPLVWTIFDEESEIIAEQLRARGFTAFEVLSGDVPTAKRQPILDRYRKGETPVLISKASLLGYGMNFQHCGSMIFSGWNDSFEQLYQAIRRAVRYGQTRRVRVHFPYIEELEGPQLDTVFRKAKQFEEIVAEQETAYIAAMQRLNLLNQEVA